MISSFFSLLTSPLGLLIAVIAFIGFKQARKRRKKVDREWTNASRKVAAGSAPGAPRKSPGRSAQGYAKQSRSQLRRAAYDALREKTGQELTFAGRLVRCDGFMRNLYLARGRIEL